MNFALFKDTSLVWDINRYFLYLTISPIYDVFSKEIIDILKLLTREENIEYDEYIKRIKNNSIACKVKIADLTHNLDKTRLDFVTEVDVKRNEKYKKALQILYY